MEVSDTGMLLLVCSVVPYDFRNLPLLWRECSISSQWKQNATWLPAALRLYSPLYSWQDATVILHSFSVVTPTYIKRDWQRSTVMENNVGSIHRLIHYWSKHFFKACFQHQSLLSPDTGKDDLNHCRLCWYYKHEPPMTSLKNTTATHMMILLVKIGQKVFL